MSGKVEAVPECSLAEVSEPTLPGWLVPRLRGRLPRRYWRKVVTAVQGIALALAASGIVPGLAGPLVGLALALLVESFGRDVLWLVLPHRRLSAGREGGSTRPAEGGARAPRQSRLHQLSVTSPRSLPS